MQDLNFSIFINAPKEKVWDTMLEDATYRQWTKPFNETSYFKGDWSEGSEILFLGTDKNGENEAGMYSRIAKNIPFEYISIEHLGVLQNGIRTPWIEEGSGYENYKFIEKDGGTEVLIELTNTPEEYTEMMNAMWPKALEILKALSEK
ncbi:MAG: SRPBCC domain-containing protein [Candidatus Paceibacterota bacterium]